MAKTAYKQYFSKNPTVNQSRTLFDMSKTDTVTINPDYYYPNFKQLILPGDTVVMDYSNMVRMLDPLQVPMMDNLYLDTHFWFVPFDQVWDYTAQFFGEKKRPSDPTISSLPQIQFTSSTLPQSGSVYDYFGIPIANSSDSNNLLTGAFQVQALPLLSYYAIHDDWIRDEQRQDYLLDSPDFKKQLFNASDFSLYKRGKRFDYFTSTILEPNMPSTTMSIANSGLGNQNLTPVFSDGFTHTYSHNPLIFRAVDASGSEASVASHPLALFPNTGSSDSKLTLKAVSGSPSSALQSAIYPANLYADLNGLTIGVEAMRRAFQVQAYQEIIQRYGTRFPEYIYSMYGVITDDLLYRRCEYLGGTHQRLSVQPIVQQSANTTNNPLGQLGGIVQGATSDAVFTRSFTQYGYIIGCINIYADLTYFQGLERDWSLVDKMDFPLNVFANLTDQPVYKREIALTGTSTDSEVFGYQEIYAWAKYNQNSLRGLVRPNAPLSVGYWSLAQKFASVPINNDAFITSNTDISRITSVTTGASAQHFIVNQKFDVKITRELPAHSNPMKWFERG